MSAPRLIGVTGLARHGKNAVGEVLVREFGFTQVGFADALKSMALVLDPWIPTTMQDHGGERLSARVGRLGWGDAKSHPEVRRFLQVLGTEGVRAHIDDDAWIEALERRFDREGFSVDVEDVDGGIAIEWARPVVITDVRFPNEADAIEAWGGQLWRVVRPGFDNGLDLLHPSEQHVQALDVGVEIVNDGTLDDLAAKVRAALGAE